MLTSRPGQPLHSENEGSLDEAVRLSCRRLIPFLLLMYVLAFLDRVNIGFAKQSFQSSTGISDAAYAFGAGLFFVTYALLEVPSNLMMHRVGARRWLARIMVSWGLISGALMFARGPASFYALRALLGAAEAGFFPGVILYLTYWFPKASVGRIFGLFYFGAPIAFIVGGPLSGSLLRLDGIAGIAGWQWMFLLEGLLASATGVWAYFYLDDKPAAASWLPEHARAALVASLAGEEEHRTARTGKGRNYILPLLHFAAIYLLIQASVYGVVFYLPTQVAALLGKRVGLEVGLVTAVPWLCALLLTYLLPRFADRHGGHRVLATLVLLVSASGIAVSAAGRPVMAFVALCCAAAAFNAVQPLFWIFPVASFGGVAAAGGIAFINASGAIGGFVAPNVRNWAEVYFHSPHAGLYLLALASLVAAILVLLLRSGQGPIVFSEAPESEARKGAAT